MNKETLIEKLLTEKAEKNNTIDLNAYALGLDAMYEALVLYDVSGSLPKNITIWKKAREMEFTYFRKWWFSRVGK